MHFFYSIDSFKNHLFVLLVGAMALLSACDSSGLIAIEGLEELRLNANCVAPAGDELVMELAAEYNAVLLENPDDCADFALPYIDFEQRSLLVKYVQATACAVTYYHQILADPDSKTYFYQLDVSLSGDCTTDLSEYVWLSVPKIPEDYTVDFQVNVLD